MPIGRAYRGRHSNELILGGDAAGEFDAESPGSGGASPYLRRGLPVWVSPNNVTPKILARIMGSFQAAE